ncbi:MAG: DUF1043 family protein [Pasteurellaceae bacterium]|nr:DUF1043 family protein [Pasteurellaceae bacterium]
MQVWTTEMWQSAIIGVIIGALLAYLFIRFTKGSVKKQAKTEAELQQVKAELANQKQQLEQHFGQSAELLKTMAQDYQKLYHHLANASATLLPELESKPLFPNKLIEQQPSEPAQSEDNPPRDYSEGSSGILKAEK